MDRAANNLPVRARTSCAAAPWFTAMEDPGFRAAIASDAPVLVLFTASWCPFCARFEPLWREAATRFRGETAVAHLEDEDDPRWDEFRVEVVPSLAVFRRGRVVARRDGILGRGLLRADVDAFLAILATHTGAFKPGSA
jgi:thioredoxin 1